MILYGVCITDANSYNMDDIRELMQKAEIYEDFLSDMVWKGLCMMMQTC